MNNKVERKTNWGIIILAFLVFVFGGASGYLYYQYSMSKQELDKLSDPNYVSNLQEQQVEITLEKLEKIMLLPEEDPTIATLIDVDALREENESFYVNAQNGDKLIIYTEQAILFREEENKIINVAPVFIEPNQEEVESNEESESETELESDEEELDESTGNYYDDYTETEGY